MSDVGGTLQIQHTPGHRDCPACRWASQMRSFVVSPELTFREAFGVWIDSRVIDHAGSWSNARYISHRTERDLRQYARAAERFFGDLKLNEIHAGHLREYQRARATCDKSCGNWADRAGANLIRKEVGVVQRVMRAAGAWSAHLEESFEPLPAVESDIGRALTPDEQHRFLHVAASREPWRIVYWWSILALQTTMSTNEMRALRLGDLYLDQGIIQVRSEGAKNKFRIRTIPLQTPEAVWALNSLLQRAFQLGASGPHHYLFPLHVTAKRYDPLQQMTPWGLRKPWQKVRSAADLEWLRIYDLRHTAITRLAEAGTPIQVIMSLAGHMSPRMQQHYTTISMMAKRRWAAAAFQGAEMPYMGTAPAWGQAPQLPPLGQVAAPPAPRYVPGQPQEEPEAAAYPWLRAGGLRRTAG